MAQPIKLDAPVRDPRKELITQLEKAPAEHAEALLDLYDVLQQMHERRMFDLVRGAVAGSDKLIEHVVDAVDSPRAIAGLRNLLVLAEMMGSIDPCVMRSVANAVTETMGANAQVEPPPSLLSLLGQFRRKELRRSISFINRFLGALGNQLRSVPEHRQHTPAPRRDGIS